MPVDSFAVTALGLELSAALEGARIDKIHMPAKSEVHILGRSASGSYRLLLSANPQRARAHLSTTPRENPQTPPMFCMLLRKHLTNGRFAGLWQPALERALHFRFDSADELGVISRKTLVVELMGRNSNIILNDSEGRIIDCLKRVDPEMSQDRPVLPGLFYKDPPRQNKTDPLNITPEEFTALYQAKPPELADNDWLSGTFVAFSPLLSKDIAADTANIESNFFRLTEQAKSGKYIPIKIKNGTDFFALPLANTPQTAYSGTFSELLDEIYTNVDLSENLRQKASALTKRAKSSLAKITKKIALMEKELEDAMNREHYREKADLLMANLHRAERGAESVVVENFYDENRPLTISLNPAKSPQQNAALLYKSYAKAKKAETVLAEQIDKAERDAFYWESVVEQLSRIESVRDLEEIKGELFPPPVNTKKANKSAACAEPLRFRSSEGVIFRVGRNNRQNDLLTGKIADRNDIWMHVQKIPGCHLVIEQNADMGEQTLEEAAAIAAFYSSGKNSPKVPVDYTAVKFVKKPPGSKPGMVTYSKFKTILTEPSEELAERLKF